MKEKTVQVFRTFSHEKAQEWVIKNFSPNQLDYIHHYIGATREHVIHETKHRHSCFRCTPVSPP